MDGRARVGGLGGFSPTPFGEDYIRFQSFMGGGGGRMAPPPPPHPPPLQTRTLVLVFKVENQALPSL